MIRRVLLLLVATLLTVASPAAAAEPKTSVIDLEDEVMCVSCNVPLNIAESPQATAQRAEIQRLVDQGLTKDEIKDRLVVEYGRNVLAQPDDTGFGLAAYVVPIAVGGLGIAILVLLIPRWRRRATAGPGLSVPTPVEGGAPGSAASPESAGGTPSAAAERRLDAELARFDR